MIEKRYRYDVGVREPHPSVKGMDLRGEVLELCIQCSPIKKTLTIPISIGKLAFQYLFAFLIVWGLIGVEVRSPKLENRLKVNHFIVSSGCRFHHRFRHSRVRVNCFDQFVSCCFEFTNRNDFSDHFCYVRSDHVSS